MRKRAKAAALSVFALGAAAYLSAPVLAKRALIGELEARGWDAAVQQVSLTRSGVRLSGLDMTSKDKARHVVLSFALIELDYKLSPKQVTAEGGKITMSGRWPKAKSEAGASGRSMRIRIKNVPLLWEDIDGSGTKVEADCVTANLDTSVEVLLEGLIVQSKWGQAKSHSMRVIKGSGKTEAKSPEVILFARGHSIRLHELEVMDVQSQGGSVSFSAAAARADLPWGLSVAGAQAAVTAAPGEGGARISVQAQFKSATGQHGAVAEDSVTLPETCVSGEMLVQSARRWSWSADVTAGQVPLKMLASRDAESWKLEASMGWTPCSDVLQAVPDSMKQELVGMRLGGEMRSAAKVSEQSGKTPEAFFELVNKCKVLELPDKVSAALSGKPFARTIYSSTGRRTGKSAAAGWPAKVSLADVSPYMAKAVVTTEDPGFWGHKGIDVEAVRNSIRDNVKDRKFVRGASTITMQLAKNMFLSRDKTASRKVQEFFLVMAIEQRMTKDRILEAYLSAVEFGPDIWGIGQAANHYFGTDPSRLSLAQSVFLASILPRPRASYFGASGKMHEAKRNHVNLILDLMLRRGSITDEECRMAKEEDLVLGSPESGVGELDASEWTTE